MFSFSEFKHEWTKSQFKCEVPISKDYKVRVNGRCVPVYSCRISAYPYNIWWLGHQRPIGQSELASYVNLVSDEEITVEVEPLSKKAFDRVMLKPYSKGVRTQVSDGVISFTLKESCGYVLELDDYHNPLYIFNNKPIEAPDPATVTHYFGSGVHFAGKVTLKSGESLYVDKDAIVYGCIFAENAENIRVFGNGIFDDGTEERVCEHCYEPYTNGNIKLYDCKNVKIEGVGFTNSAIWCVNIFHCEDVVIDGIKVFGQWRYNTDGIDLVNSKNIIVRNSFIHSFDDTITVKGIDRYASFSCEDMLFENDVLWCDWGKTCEIGLETAAPEFKNITFRNCDVLRGGNTVCDIQNGDCAQVSNILFEDIRVELEGFYTEQELQTDEDAPYSKKNTLDVTRVLMISNKRFRTHDLYVDIGFDPIATELSDSDPRFASVKDVTVRNITLYADKAVLAARGKKCVRISINRDHLTSEYRNITVDGITLNGERVLPCEMEYSARGVEITEVLTVK